MIRSSIAVLVVSAALVVSTSAAPFLQGPAKPEAKSPKSTQQIVDELNADLETARSRLGQDDAGAMTRGAQQRVLDNFDRLLNQQDPGSGQSASSSPTPKSNGENMPAPKPEASPPQQRPSPSEVSKAQAKSSASSTAKPASMKQISGSERREPPASLAEMRNQPGEDGLWPRFPPRIRQSMDAFGTERFLPQYEEMLRAYYRAIADSNRRE